MIFFTFISCYLYINQIIYIIVNYLLYNMNSHRLIFTKITEVFYTYLKISLTFSLLICFPFIILQIWLFIIPGLYKTEKLFFNFFLIIILFLYIISILFSYKIIIPKILNFFLLFEKGNLYFPLHFEARLKEYLNTIIFIYIYMLFCFQIPTFVIILLYLKIINLKNLINKRKYIYIFFLLLSSLIVPPEIFNQLFLSLFFCIFYEVVILLILFFIKFFNIRIELV